MMLRSTYRGRRATGRPTEPNRYQITELRKGRAQGQEIHLKPLLLPTKR